MRQNGVDINAIMRQFDQYVEVSLQNKSSEEQHENCRNQLDQYYHTMQKRLKIKTMTQNHKFQKIIGPMKKLRSFVSIKEFLRGLHQKSLKSQNQPNIMSQNTKRKLEYEDLRGGLYMEKVQKHLKRKHLKRKLDAQAEYLLNELQEKQTQKNQYRTWMENVLSKISMKEESFLKPIDNSDLDTQANISPKQFILSDLTNTDIKKAKRENHKRRMSEEKEQKNFKKVSDFLAERLKKILTDKYVNNSSKQNKKNKEMLNQFNYDDCCFKMVAQPSNNLITYRKAMCRTTATSKRIRDSVQTGGVSIRAQTTELKNRRGTDDIWKNKLNTKMDNFMLKTNDYYLKCQQEKKEYRKLVNPYSDLAKDENLN